MNTVEIIAGEPRVGKAFFTEPVNLTICEGEQLAIIGANGSGKRVLVEMIMGEQPLKGEGIKYNFHSSENVWVCENIKHIAFRDSYGAADKNYYYQQRWNSMGCEGQKTVQDVMPKAKNQELQDRLFELFNIKSLLEKELILLSSGEMRKFQLTKALLSAPQMLILESPFIGLDSATRQQLSELLSKLSREANLQVVLVLSKSDELPDFVTHVVEIKDKICKPKVSVEQYLSSRETDPKKVLSTENEQQIIALATKATTETKTVVDINNISIRYGKHTILEDLSWRILRGEKWALSGENGAGKSTLLSLICADNPQGYACDITLFGMRRGVGASIWDIKANIGYVSPEMHRSYMVSAPCIEIVASGLHDTVGLYKKMKAEDRAICEFWMDIFSIKELAERDFMRISSGEQRLILLARAFVKDPELLVLDEPLHGLDMRNRRLTLDVIEAFCKRENKSVIYVTHYTNELPKCINNSYRLTKPASRL